MTLVLINEIDSLIKGMNVADNFPCTFEQLEAEAKDKLCPPAFDYIQSGASAEETLRKNTDAFASFSIVPNLLKDVSNVDTTIKLFEKTYAHPFLLAPVGMLKIAHENGELAVAKAAANLQVPVIQSTVSSYSIIEEVSKAVPDSPKWFQLYWSNNEAITFSMAKRAENLGYEAIVLTVDTFMFGWREKDMGNRFSPLKEGFGKANYETDEVFLKHLSEEGDTAIIKSILENIYHPSLNWEHVKRLKEQSNLPILLKGILHPENAREAIANGIDGIIVSNHGGRQLDGVISSIETLPAIAEAVAGKIPILLDSGIRRGTDVVKAIALGADAVLIGRPYVYGLALDGQNGVGKVLEQFIQQTKVSISLAGATSINDVQQLMIV
ncbi:alpha-hydroxy-acid oxidizing protein [Virgibacillus sp. W0181]|uniref:alpha-hydroxy-acid oxidizing protein n=1 Tax=Virgibacillus sp. W0181 TaxID=3391581 RepID=UPI003F4629AB